MSGCLAVVLVVGAESADWLEPSSDGLHDAGPESWWREAWYFEFYDPRTQLQFQAYQGVFPNASSGDINAAVFRAGQPVHELRKVDFRVLPEPRSERLCFGPMKIEPIEALRRWRIRYDTTEFCADLEFTAVHPPFGWPRATSASAGSAGDRPPGSFHFDQLGRYRGRCRLGGDELEIDALGFRDRMWGWGERKHWRSYLIMWAAFDEDCVATVALQQFDDGRESLCGYLHLEGLRSPLRSAELALRWDERRWKSIAAAEVSVEDQRGRHFDFTGQPQGILDTSHRWQHRNDHMLFSVGHYRHGELDGHGVMNWAFSSAADQRTRYTAFASPQP